MAYAAKLPDSSDGAKSSLQRTWCGGGDDQNAASKSSDELVAASDGRAEKRTSVSAGATKDQTDGAITKRNRAYGYYQDKISKGSKVVNSTVDQAARETAIIIGAGPAGLTAAFELLARTNIKPIILEKSNCVGGLARTEVYKGNRIDIGPHRFFSKSDRVMDWWLNIMPLAAPSGAAQQITYQQQTRTVVADRHNIAKGKTDKVMLTLQRKTRIYYLRKFFDYPISLKLKTLQNLGLGRTLRIGLSYLKALALPIEPEKNLEQFIINRFGEELYRTFFKDYTEKVWGVECNQISAAWGAQRIKGLSIAKTITHAFTKIFGGIGGIGQKKTETSLVEQFLYPKQGTGSMWEEVARQVKEKGGEIHMGMAVDKVTVKDMKIESVEAIDTAATAPAGTRESNQQNQKFAGDYFFSTMPIKELVRSFNIDVPPEIKAISEGLIYRDFVQVGLLLNKLSVYDQTKNGRRLISDNWIYIQESDVKVGRMQIWNNWGPCMVADPTKVWLGLEYFVNEGDHIWNLSDQEMIALAKRELAKINIAEESDVIDAVVLKVPKTYPAYFGTYDRFNELSNYLDRFENLFLIGRNGQHRYNNQDHSMLAAMTAVDNIVNGVINKDNLWAVNTEMEYHEEKNS